MVNAVKDRRASPMEVVEDVRQTHSVQGTYPPAMSTLDCVRAVEAIATAMKAFNAMRINVVNVPHQAL